MGHHAIWLGVAAALAAGSIDVATAQTAPAADATTSSKTNSQLEEITVTAEKRTEDVRKVPLSVSVLSGNDIETQHIDDFGDLTRAVPNLSYSGASGSGPGLNNIEIRGISSAAGQSTVGIYLDDVSLTTRNLYSQGAPEPKFFDIDRIEVLRGPQGTLYGASSMGGTIKVITNQPNTEEYQGSFYSELSGTDGGGLNYTATGVVNVPLVAGKVGMRIGVQSSTDDGYIDLVSPTDGHIIKSNINVEHDMVGRLAFKLTPNEDLTITPSVFYQRVATDDIDASYLELPKNETDKLVQEPGQDRMVVPSLTVGYNLGFADLTSVSSYFYRDFHRVQDGTSINSPFLGTQVTDPTLGALVGGLPSAVNLDNKIGQVSQEIRLASKPYDGSGLPVTWLGGLFYSDEHTKVSDNEPIFGLNAAFAAAGQDPTNPADLAGGFPNDFVNDNSYFSERRYDTRQYAAFGEASYYITPAIKATAGARYLFARDGLDRVGDFYYAGGPVASAVTGHSYALTPKFALSWDVDDENTVYANATKGFRLGSENRPVPLTTAVQEDLQNLGLTSAPAAYQPDKLWNYEIGSKSRFLDNRLSVNASLFYIDWTSIQQDVFLPISGFDFETNLGNAESYGAELEIKGKVTPQIILGASGSYTHATLTTAEPTLGIPSGAKVEGVPDWNATFTGEYDFIVAGRYDTFLRGAWNWVGASHGTLISTDPDYTRPVYQTIDASFGVDLGDWEVSIFGKNLSNNDKVIQRPNVQGVNEGYRLRPMTIGVSVSGKF
jgi:iron complex outermembrane recepter protein